MVYSIKQNGNNTDFIYNTLETGLVGKECSNKSKHETTAPGYKMCQDWETIIVVGNVTVNYRLTVFIIGKSKKKNPNILKRNQLVCKTNQWYKLLC